MKTRSGHKYQDGKGQPIPETKSPPKETKFPKAKAPKSKAKSDVKEMPIQSKNTETVVPLRATRSKYQDGKGQTTTEIKSPQKEIKHLKAKVPKSDVKEIPIQSKSSETVVPLRATRSGRKGQTTTEIKSPQKETNISKTKAPKSKAKQDIKETPMETNSESDVKETPIQTSNESDVKEIPIQTKSSETVVPLRATRSVRKGQTTTEIKSPQKETNVSKAKAPKSKPKQDIKETPMETSSESDVKETRIQTSNESDVKDQTTIIEEIPIQSKSSETVVPLRATRSGRKYQDGKGQATTEIKAPPKEIKCLKAKAPKSKTKSDIKETPMETSSESDVKEPSIQTRSESDVKETSMETSPESDVKETLIQTSSESDVKDTPMETNNESDVKDTPMETNNESDVKEETPIQAISIESDVKQTPIQTIISESDVKETPIQTISSESDVKETQIQKKRTTDVPPQSDSAKRPRISRFTIPTIPQICGQLYSFGEEIAGELGPRLRRVDEIKLKPNEPSIVTDKEQLSLDNIVSVVCGAMHSTCLSSEGELITFGCNDDSALGRDTQTCSDETDDSIDVDESEEKEARTPKIVVGLPPVIKMTAGDMHTCALCKDGSVYVWGNFKDESKKLGLFVDSLKDANSDDISATSLPKPLNLEVKIVDIASGCHHILLLTDDGDVLSFGEGSKGQLGRIKDTELQTIASDRQLFLNPQKVEFGTGVVIEKIWAEHWSSYAKSTSGDIFVWGLNNYHQLGFKSNGSVRITNSDPNESQTTINLIIELKPTKAEKMPPNVVMIANGQHHMLALDAEGQVFSCGSNTYGKLGYKTENNDQTADTPHMISTDAFNGQKVKHIACGEFCSFAITESGHLMAWGQGSAHIGSEGFTDIEVPTRVKGSLVDNTRFVSVSSGSLHTLLIGNMNKINGN